MKNILSILIMSIIFTGCSMISANYIQSSSVETKLNISANEIQVYYDKEDVPFKYKEIGRIFLKNINYLADRDPAGQINKIKKEASLYGAEAVIIVSGTRKESSFCLIDNVASGNAGDVFQYSGIAIVRE